MRSALRDLWSGVRSLAGILARDRVFAGPRSATLAISDVCNTNCIMCPCHSPLLAAGGAPANPYMEPRIFETIVRECGAMGTLRVALCGGGEPALHPQFDRMLELIARLGMEPYVITNGINIGEARLKLWASLRAHYRFSVHAGDEETWLQVHPAGRPGQFDQLTRALKTLTAGRSVRVSTLHVIHKANFAKVRAMIEHARETGVGQVIFRPVQASGKLSSAVLSPDEESRVRAEMKASLALAESYRIRTNLREYLRNGLWIEAGRMNTAHLYKKIPCYIGWLNADFGRDGAMVPCVDSRRAMGRAGERPIREIWNSSLYWTFRRESRAMPQSGKLVAGCACSQCCLAPYNVNLYNLMRLKSLAYGRA